MKPTNKKKKTPVQTSLFDDATGIDRKLQEIAGDINLKELKKNSKYAKTNNLLYR